MNLWKSDLESYEPGLQSMHKEMPLFSIEAEPSNNISFEIQYENTHSDGLISLNYPVDFNATEYLKNQFNPFVKENIPPMLLTVSISHHNEWGWEKCEIHARVYDVGGIGKLWIYHDFFGDLHSFKASNNGWYNVTLEIGWGGFRRLII